MLLLLYIIIAFILFLSIGQTRNHLRANAVKKYFRIKKLNHILVCNDYQTKEYWQENIDRNKYKNIEVVNIYDPRTTTNFIDPSLLAEAVKKAGIMRYPCLLTLDEDGLHGKAFEQN